MTYFAGFDTGNAEKFDVLGKKEMYLYMLTSFRLWSQC